MSGARSGIKPAAARQTARPYRAYSCTMTATTATTAMSGCLRRAGIALWIVLLFQGYKRPAQPTLVAVPPDILAVVRAEAEREGGVDTLAALAESGDMQTRRRPLRGLGRTGGSRAVDVVEALVVGDRILSASTEKE